MVVDSIPLQHSSVNAVILPVMRGFDESRSSRGFALYNTELENESISVKCTSSISGDCLLLRRITNSLEDRVARLKNNSSVLIYALAVNVNASV